MAMALVTIVCIVWHLSLRWVAAAAGTAVNWPLWAALGLGGAPLVLELGFRLLRRQFGSDLLAAISIITAVLLEEYLAGSLVVLMLSGGLALESMAVRRASSVLDALARRMPSTAHRKTPTGMEDIGLADVAVGDVLVVLPHEVCPADGVVIEGHGSMD
ncbi:MAG: heavy metal translocating P-type ATPase, partial [Pirellulales bacterium]|nr:heavy metal translocating P-type ATPase [Pirellulales bacterium]